MRRLCLRATGGLFVQGPRLLSLVRRAPHGRHRGAPRRPRAARGPRSAMGALAALCLALPPGLRRCARERGPRPLRAQGLQLAPASGSAPERRSAASSVRRGHVRAALRGRAQPERPLPLPRARRRLRTRAGGQASLPPAPTARGCGGGARGTRDRAPDLPAARTSRPSRGGRSRGRRSAAGGAAVARGAIRRLGLGTGRHGKALRAAPPPCRRSHRSRGPHHARR